MRFLEKLFPLAYHRQAAYVAGGGMDGGTSKAAPRDALPARNLDMTKKRIVSAVFPNPFANDPWLQNQHPVLLQMAEAMSRQGCDCVPTPAFTGLFWLFRNRKKLDVVHFHWPEAYYRPSKKSAKILWPWMRVLGIAWLYAFVFLARFLRIPIVWTLNDLYPHGESPTRAFERSCRSYLMRNVSSLILCGDSAEPVARAEFGPARHVVSAPLGNYRDFYPDGLSETDARARLGLSPDETVFLCFGTMRENRNAIELISVFRQIPAKNLRLIVVGGTPAHLRDQMEASAWADWRIRCHFQQVPNEELEMLMKASDWVVVPGRNYLTSAVLVLGLSYGRPVITSDYGCAPSIAGEAGFLYDQDAPGGLMTALGRAIAADKAEYRRKAEERARQLSWDDTAVQMMKSYRAALAASGRGSPNGFVAHDGAQPEPDPTLVEPID